MNVSIIGLGLIGGSMGLDLRRNGFARTIVGVEASSAHAELALNLNLVDRVEALDSALAGSDVVILAVPMNALHELLPHVLDQVGPTTTVTDVGSTKRGLCELVTKHPRRRQFVAAHPMAGTEHSGPKAAHTGLFQGKAAVICDADESAPEHVKRVQELFLALGMRLISMGSQEHDLHAAYVSHLSHITSFILANTVLDKENDVEAIFNLASGGFESTARLAKSSPEMWAPIFRQNREPIAEALEAYISRLQTFHRHLVAQDDEQLLATMRQANQIRRVLEKISNGKK
jgi:prephenate dehydrogenase